MAKNFLPIIVFLPLILIFTLKGKITQDTSYHQFSDQLQIVGVHNFHNVFSNILFLVFGALGIKDYFKRKSEYTISWFVFYTGVFMVAFGSAYYHLAPNNQTLLWDRLPMSIAFMGIFSAISSEIYKVKNEIKLLIPLVTLGAYSVFHWSLTDDLRLYSWVQMTPILVMLFTSIFIKTKSLKSKYTFGAVLFYAGAKVFETYDKQIHISLGYSGHAIKHFLAAFSVLSLIQMKKR